MTVYNPPVPFAADIVTRYIRSGKFMAGGSTKVAEAEAKGKDAGFALGLCQGLSSYANELRFKALEPYAVDDDRPLMLPAVYETHFMPWMRGIQQRWDEGEWKEVEDEEFYGIVSAEFMGLVFDKDFTAFLEVHRKNAVRSGKVDPEPEDIKWIEEELNAFEEMSRPYRHLKEKLSGNAESSRD